jgi:formylglycine-generating enzyme
MRQYHITPLDFWCSKSRIEVFAFHIFVASCGLLSAADPVASNVRASQQPGTQLADITYGLAEPDSASVVVSDNTGSSYVVQSRHFQGYWEPGNTRKITWDAKTNWPGKFSLTMRFRDTASDHAVPTVPTGMALIPAGFFTMGDTLNDWLPSNWAHPEIPVHTVFVSGFYMDKILVTKAVWEEVYGWALAHGYSFDNAGLEKSDNHPVHTVNWWDVVKWCNARSEKEGRMPSYYTDAARKKVYRTDQVDVQNEWVRWNAGYRLPTEAEWEKAARGGASGHRFPWSDADTITHRQANYYSSSLYSYDVSRSRGYHPNCLTGGQPSTSPVGSFDPNAYGLYDMAGNVWEWCWDWYGSYSSGSQTDPRGPTFGSYRVFRGGAWDFDTSYLRCSHRDSGEPGYHNSDFGFRCVLAQP